MPLPLEGVLAVGLEQAVAAPLCTCRLADAGARVIKVERPEGDFARTYDSVAKGESAYFVWLNRGKESLVADLKKEADRNLLRRIISRADVLVENLKPGASERLGLGTTELMQKNPRLIVCSISGYGSAGPMKDRKAYDLLVQAESGLASVTGAPEGPGRVGVSVADIAAGMYAYEAILEALFAREKSGAGGRIEVSLFDALADWMTVPLLHFDYGGKAPQRVGLRHPSIAPYGVYETSDGQAILISIQNEREWHRLCRDALACPGLVEDDRFGSNEKRVRNRPALEDALQAIFGSLTYREASQRLDSAEIAFATLNGVAGLSRHPALRRIGVDTPSGHLDLPAPPAKHTDPQRQFGPVPEKGQHSAAIRKEFQNG